MPPTSLRGTGSRPRSSICGPCARSMRTRFSGRSRKTGHLIVADTSWELCGVASEIAALAAEKAFSDLRLPCCASRSPIAPPRFPQSSSRLFIRKRPRSRVPRWRHWATIPSGSATWRARTISKGLTKGPQPKCGTIPTPMCRVASPARDKMPRWLNILLKIAVSADHPPGSV